MDFHADDWFTITGRGKVAMVKDHGLIKREDARALVNGPVTIDGVEYILTGVELSLDLLQGDIYGPIGLLVREIDEQNRQDDPLASEGTAQPEA